MVSNFDLAKRQEAANRAELIDIEGELQQCIIPSQAASLLSTLTPLLAEMKKARTSLLAVCEDKDIAAVHKEFSEQKAIYTRCHQKLSDIVASATTLPPSPSPSMMSTSSFQLPQLKLPTFDGNQTEWTDFSSLFTDIIQSAPSLVTPVQQHHLLMQSLSGAAKELVRYIAPSPTSFTVAWGLLEEKYANIKDTIQTLCMKVFENPTCTSPSDITHLVDVTRSSLRALDSLKETSRDAWLHTFILTRIPTEAAFAWKRSNTSKQIPPTTDLLDFLYGWSMDQGKLNYSHNLFPSPPPIPTTSHPNKQTTRSFTLRCPDCHLDHFLYKCPSFFKATVDERWTTVQRLQVCINCLSDKHSICHKQVSCKVCNEKHHSMLHRMHKAGPSAAVAAIASGPRNIIFATALVLAISPTGKRLVLRAVLDPCSDLTLISREAAQRLQLQPTGPTLCINAFNNIAQATAQSALCTITSLHSSDAYEMQCYIIDEMMGPRPSSSLNLADFQQLIYGKKMADPAFHISADIDILIGMDYYPLLLRQRNVGTGSSLVLQETALGWVVMGNQPAGASVIPSMVAATTIGQNFTRFWELEELPEKTILSTEDKAAETVTTATLQHCTDGHYMVRLPLRRDPTTLGNSRAMAVSRYLALERRFHREPQFKHMYTEVINDYLTSGHMELAPVIPSNPYRVTYYLPHHGVLKPTSTTTALRVVFDASAKTSTATSLNDILYTGPALQDDLFTILLKFRKHPIALTADISKMYRRVWLHEEDRDLHRVLWRSSPSDDIQEYRLTTVTFGVKSAPYLAKKALQQVAKSCNDSHVAAIILKDFYVDDLLSGAPTLADATRIQKSIASTLEAAGFPTHKWASNHPEAIAHVPPESKATTLTLNDNQQEHQSLKTLGVSWNTLDDTFRIEFMQPIIDKKWTRRSILSFANSIFDPLGWLAPVPITAKIQLQALVHITEDWDEKLPTTYEQAWTTWLRNIQNLRDVQIPRCIQPYASSVTLCGYADASERAYGAVVYSRIVLPNGTILIRLVAAKTRVAPLKTTTLPRLELEAAYLLSQLMKSIVNALSATSTELYAWTDSTITLAWIRAHPSRWQTFVANRVSAIQEILPESCWRHVKSEDNPADLASRGMRATDLVTSKLWWNGPHWLMFTLDSGPEPPPPSSLLEEKKPKAPFLTAVVQVVPENELLRRFSSWTTLRRVVAYMLLFKDLALKITSPTKKWLSTNHIRRADNAIYRIAQQESFTSDVQVLRAGQPVPLNSPLAPLDPFMDEDGLLRVGGRLRHAHLPKRSKHPILLSPKHVITPLLIKQTHENQLHAGTTATDAVLRQRFWILNSGTAVKKQLRLCLICTKSKARLCSQMMADLPPSRVLPVSRPFTRCGIDFAGPIMLKSYLARSTRSYKAYIALFVCFTTRAIHLELVTALTSSAFLAAFARFTSRRGLPHTLYSDNGTNFTGAQKELRRITNNAQLQGELATRGVSWEFNPPSAPHFGGLWEAGVKSLKTHLRRVLQENLLTYEEYNTVICRTEAALNSRPLVALTDDPSDLEVLTPAHFLIGGQLENIPEDDLSCERLNTLSRWHLVQRLSQDLWRRWSAEYLTRLQNRPKWWRKSPNLQVGALVLIQDPNRPPLNWRLGRVKAVHPGKDGNVRIATLHTAYGDMQRPIHKLCLLPLAGDDRTEKSIPKP